VCCEQVAERVGLPLGEAIFSRVSIQHAYDPGFRSPKCFPSLAQGFEVLLSHPTLCGGCGLFYPFLDVMPSLVLGYDKTVVQP